MVYAHRPRVFLKHAPGAQRGVEFIIGEMMIVAMQVGASSLRGHKVSVPDTPWSAIGGMEEVGVFVLRLGILIVVYS